MPDKRKPGGTRGGHEPKKRPAEAHSGFAALGLIPELLKSCEKAGWVTPTPVQQQAIPEVLAGFDLFGVAQTGTGKTAAYALPVLQLLVEKDPAPALNPYCVVLAPTRELVQQIGDQFTQLSAGLNIRVITAYGGTSDRPQSTALSEGVEVVCGAPGRVFDLMSQGYLQYAHLSHCVLDEADRMFDMGFIDDIKSILNRMPSRRQTLMFSATLPPAIKKLAADYLFYPREVRIGPVAPPSELKHEMLATGTENKYGELSKLLDDVHESVLVFCGTRKRAGEVAVRLGRDGERTAALHADRTQAERDRALAAFKERRIRVLVATDVASRGLDIDDVDLVVNYDVPRDPEDYVHRVGRTARAKKTGLAVTFVAPEDMKYVKRIEQFIGQRVDWRGGQPQPAGRADTGGASHGGEKRSDRGGGSGSSRGRGSRGKGGGRGGSRGNKSHGRGSSSGGGRGSGRKAGGSGSKRGGRGGSGSSGRDHSGDSSYID